MLTPLVYTTSGVSRYLLMVLGLEEVELLLDPVTGLAHRELEGLPRLRRTLQQTQHYFTNMFLTLQHISGSLYEVF